MVAAQHLMQHAAQSLHHALAGVAVPSARYLRRPLTPARRPAATWGHAGAWKALDALLRPGLLKCLSCCEDLAQQLAEAGQHALLCRLLPNVRDRLP